jgi:hypothetical protein
VSTGVLDWLVEGLGDALADGLADWLGDSLTDGLVEVPVDALVALPEWSCEGLRPCSPADAAPATAMLSTSTGPTPHTTTVRVDSLRIHRLGGSNI